MIAAYALADRSAETKGMTLFDLIQHERDAKAGTQPISVPDVVPTPKEEPKSVPSPFALGSVITDRGQAFIVHRTGENLTLVPEGGSRATGPFWVVSASHFEVETYDAVLLKRNDAWVRLDAARRTGGDGMDELREMARFERDLFDIRAQKGAA